MSKLFSDRKRFIGLGLVSAFVLALAVLGTLWGLGQTASADPDGSVSLVHVNTDGSDYAGNPACPGTGWSKGKVTSLDDSDYCNNVTSRNHVIRTDGFDEDTMMPMPSTCPWLNKECVTLEGVGAINVIDWCGNIPEARDGPNWDDANDGQLCTVIHSKDPGESTVTFSYHVFGVGTFTTTPVVKEWRKLHDTVILKTGDLDKVTLPDKSKVYLPKDADDDGDRDTDDEHAMDHDGEIQNHSVVVDEVSKGISSMSGPIWLVDVVHGVEKPVDPVFHDPVEGAVILAFIDSPRGCTFFTNPAITMDSLPLISAGTLDYGTAVVGISNAQGQFVGPLPWPVGAQFSDEALAEAAAHLLSEGWSHTGTSWAWEPHLGVYVDTTCEEQATITFKVGYPGYVGSAPQFPEPESVTINWTTLELFKQPQIRWAGEEIVLATRWALPDEWYPNTYPKKSTLLQPTCPLATSSPTFVGWYGDFPGPWAPTTAITHHVNYVKKDPSPGALEGAYVDEDGDGSLDTLAFMGASEARGDIDNSCVSKALYDSEVQGEVSVEGKLVEATWYCDADYILVDDDGDGCVDEDPWDGLDNDTGDCAEDPADGYLAPDCDITDDAGTGPPDGDCDDEGEAALCANALDDDGDTYVNDGCPIVDTYDDCDINEDGDCEDEGEAALCENETDDETGTDATVADCDFTDDAGTGGPDGDCLDEGEAALCANDVDDDNDGYVNDGCAQVGDGAVNDGCPENDLPETGDQCLNDIDDDNDSYVNDGCPAYDPTASEDACGAGTCGDGIDNGAACDGTGIDGADYADSDCLDTGTGAETGDQCQSGNDTDDETGTDATAPDCDTNGDGDCLDTGEAALCANDVDDDNDGVVNDGCPTVGDGAVNDGCPGIGDGLIDEDPRNAVGINYDPDSHEFFCGYMRFAEFGWPAGSPIKVGDAELQTEVLINKAPFLVWYLKMYQAKLTNVPGAREDHNDGKFSVAEGADLYDPSVGDTVADEVNVSADALLRVVVKGWFRDDLNLSARGAVCIDMDGDGSGATDDDDDGDGTADEDPLDGEDNDGDTLIDEDPAPGEPYLIGAGQWETGCPDAGDEPVETGHWVLPDDFVTMASAEDLGNITPGMTASLDVMSDIGDSPKATGVVGPKSTLDSHDAVARKWIPCLADACTRKTVDPDTEITVADAIMPALKITAMIAGVTSAEHANDAGFLKGADKDDDVGITSLYQKIMIPADPEIPPFIVGSGYDWDSWLCRIEDGNVPSPYDADIDGLPEWWDNCPAAYNPNQLDQDGDGKGDACDTDIDGDGWANGRDAPAGEVAADPIGSCTDGIDNDADTKIDQADTKCTDACDYIAAIQTAADGAVDTDGDGVPVECDIDDDDDTADDQDYDQDGVKDTSDNCPTVSNGNQNDFDGDKVGDACDPDPFNKPISVMVPCPTAAYQGLGMGPYEFYHVLQTLPVTDCDDLEGELCNANLGNQLDQGPEDTAHPRVIEFYTDNRGMGFFFANGDYNLDFGLGQPDGCREDTVSGAPDCSPGDVVGESNIKVIGQYPYTRAPEKLRNVISNPAVKTWEWDGFKRVTAETVNPTHTYIIAHLADRDGYCKWDEGVKTDVDPMKVQFSPSLHPVEGEAITFEIVNGIGHILGPDVDGISPNAKFSADPSPLGKATVTDWEDGVLINSEKAVAMAEHEDLLTAIEQGAPVIQDNECQAWVLIQHPLGAELEVSVVFDDPEGLITRHWPPSTSDFFLVGGPSEQQMPPLWNDVCYIGPDQDIEDAIADIIDNALAIYRFTNDADQTWEHHFPGRCDTEGLCTIETLEPYDQLFILMADSATWTQEVTVGADADDKDEQVTLVEKWNSVCYAGDPKPVDDATASIVGDYVILYTLSNQTWQRQVPGRADLTNIGTLNKYTSVVVLVTNAAGTTWVFDP